MKVFNSRKGFSLAELMVVVLIMAILISVAVPIFLSSRDRAIARAAQSRLRNGATAAKLLFSDEDIAYNAQTKAQLDAEAAPIDFVLSAASPAAGVIDIYVITTATTATTMRLETMDANDGLWRADIAADGEVTVTQP